MKDVTGHWWKPKGKNPNRGFGRCAVIGCDLPFIAHKLDIDNLGLSSEINRIDPPKRPEMPGNFIQGFEDIIEPTMKKAFEASIPDSDWLFDAIKEGVKEAIREYIQENPTLVSQHFTEGVKEAIGGMALGPVLDAIRGGTKDSLDERR